MFLSFGGRISAAAARRMEAQIGGLFGGREATCQKSFGASCPSPSN